jgi:glycosyltransferase involved in cell wall biosynthesis
LSRARIVYVTDTLEISGGVKVIVEHAEELARRGHDVRIVTRRGAGDWLPVGVPVDIVPEIRGEALPEADVHVATWYTTVLPVVRAARAPRVVHFCQGYEAPHPHLAGELAAIHEAYRQPIPKIVISPHLVDVLAPLYPGEYHVVSQGIRLDRFEPAVGVTGPRRPATIGVVGVYEAVMKGIRVALEAVNLLRAQRPVRLLRASAFARTAEEDALCHAERYSYRIPSGEMPAWYRELDLLIHPSFEAEGFPLPPLEAMACGVPVLLTRIPSFEPLPHDAVGRVMPGDAAEMAREAARTLEDDALWNERRRRGCEVASGFPLEASIDALERALRAPCRPRGEFLSSADR